MATNWLIALENLQAQFRGLPEVEKLAEKDYQWINDVVEEATALFNKTDERGDEEDDENEDSNAGPVLLPQTPRVCLKF